MNPLSWDQILALPRLHSLLKTFTDSKLMVVGLFLRGAEYHGTGRKTAGFAEMVLLVSGYRFYKAIDFISVCLKVSFSTVSVRGRYPALLKTVRRCYADDGEIDNKGA
jgi:hypothetical protein